MVQIGDALRHQCGRVSLIILLTVLAVGQYIQDTANQDFILVILGALAMPSLPTHAARGSDKRDAMRPLFWCKIRTVRMMTRTAGQQ
jgi:hypothetical protein